MCLRYVRESTESFATIGAVVLEALRKDGREGGAKITPHQGTVLMNRHNETMHGAVTFFYAKLLANTF